MKRERERCTLKVDIPELRRVFLQSLEDEIEHSGWFEESKGVLKMKKSETKGSCCFFLLLLHLLRF